MDSKSLKTKDLININEESGCIYLLNKRILLFDTIALGYLRKEIMENLGWNSARNILTRFGYAHGWQTAESLEVEFPDLYQDEKYGPFMHDLRGEVKNINFSITHFPIMEMNADWINPYEAEQHLIHIGMASEPICWTMAGWASGYASRLFGGDIYCIESKCVGKGDDCCHMTMRYKEDWGEAVIPHLPYYQAETITGMLDDVNKRLKQSERQYWQIEKIFKDAVHPSGMIASDSKSKEIIRLASRAANSDFPVIITGDSGTGKEVLASYIHNESSCAAGPFVAFNCNAISENLIDSELFGYTKGAFTGASKDRVGLFEAANSGTLFLDEIGDASLALQGKLLRVIQEKEIRRVGENKPRPVNVRIIAATNRNLHAEIGKGNFREDLYYRLNVIELPIKPLRERTDDILPLATFFLKTTLNNINKNKSLSISPKAADLLTSYPWPGNVRELRNAMERAITVCQGNTIQVEDLPPSIRNTFLSGNNNFKITPLNEVEKQCILNALKITGGNKKIAAKQLNIGLTSLYRKLKEYDIS